MRARHSPMRVARWLYGLFFSQWARERQNRNIIYLGTMGVHQVHLQRKTTNPFHSGNRSQQEPTQSVEAGRKPQLNKSTTKFVPNNLVLNDVSCKKRRMANPRTLKNHFWKRTKRRKREILKRELNCASRSPSVPCGQKKLLCGPSQGLLWDWSTQLFIFPKRPHSGPPLNSIPLSWKKKPPQQICVFVKSLLSWIGNLSFVHTTSFDWKNSIVNLYLPYNNGPRPCVRRRWWGWRWSRAARWSQWSRTWCSHPRPREAENRGKRWDPIHTGHDSNKWSVLHHVLVHAVWTVLLPQQVCRVQFASPLPSRIV